MDLSDYDHMKVSELEYVKREGLVQLSPDEIDALSRSVRTSFWTGQVVCAFGAALIVVVVLLGLLNLTKFSSGMSLMQGCLILIVGCLFAVNGGALIGFAENSMPRKDGDDHLARISGLIDHANRLYEDDLLNDLNGLNERMLLIADRQGNQVLGFQVKKFWGEYRRITQRIKRKGEVLRTR